MKVLLISIYNTFPAGLRYIASFLENHGHDVFLKRLKYPNKIRIIEMIEKINPKVVGFTCYTLGALKVLDVARIVKQFFPEIKILLGNIHATVFYKKILEEFPFVDYVVLGEVEIPMQELLEYITGKRPIHKTHNIAYRNEEGQIIKTKKQTTFLNLDDLSSIPKGPMPKELLIFNYPRFFLYSGWQKYIFLFKLRYAAVTFTSRGCPNDCDYCSESCMSHHRWYANSPKKVGDEIESTYRKYNISHFHFEDPLFTLDKERVKKICAEIKKRNLKITWSFLTHPNYIDEELVRVISNTGCNYFTIGIDCLTDAEMFIHRKLKINYSYLARVIKLAKSLNTSVKIHLIVGWPNGSLKDALKAIQCIKELKPTYLSIVPLLYYPGSKLYNKAVTEGLLDDNYWLNAKNPAYYRVIDLKTKKNIKDYIIPKMQELIISAMFLIDCKNLFGFLHFIVYVVRCWLSNFLKYICKYFFISKYSIESMGTIRKTAQSFQIKDNV